MAQSFVDLVQRKIDDKALRAPTGEEGQRLKEAVMYPGFYLGAAVGLAQFVFLRRAPVALMRRQAGQAHFQESTTMKPFSIVFDALLSTAMAGTVWILATDKDKVFQTASDLPLAPGRSDVSDALCDDFIAQYDTIRSDFWQDCRGEQGLRAISDFVTNCRKRQALERRIRRESGLGPNEPVSIPHGGVPRDFVSNEEIGDVGGTIMDWASTEGESAWAGQKPS